MSVDVGPPVPATESEHSGRGVNGNQAGGASGDQPAVPPAPPDSLGSKSHKLWGGRFSGGPAPALEAVNRSIGIDFRLWPFDVRLSKAWAVALWNAGILTLD